MLKSRKIPITKPLFSSEEENIAIEAIRSGWVTQGPRTAEFEKEFAKAVGADYACAVSSCTTAMHLGLLALGVKPGNVVLTVSHSFIATANCVRHAQAEPVFVDIDLQDYNMCPAALEGVLSEDCESRDNKLYYRNTDKLAKGESPLAYIDKNNKEYGRVGAILPVHQAGMPADIEAIKKVAAKYNIPVMEDAACASGSSITDPNSLKVKKIGAPHSELACFSLHPRKVITTGDGGMITTNNEEYDKYFRLYRQHGMGVSDLVRHSSKKVICEDYLVTGFNYRMTDIQSAVGLAQLKKLDDIVARRRRVADLYREGFKDLGWCKTPYENPYFSSCYQSYILRLVDDSVSQIDFMQYLVDNGVASKRGVMNAHQEPPYLPQEWDLPNSVTARDRCVLLPLFPTMEDEEIEYVMQIVKGYK